MLLLLLLIASQSAALGEPAVSGFRPLPCHSVSPVPERGTTEYIYVTSDSSKQGGCTFIFEGVPDSRLEIKVHNFHSLDGRRSACATGGLKLYNHRADGTIALSKAFCSSISKKQPVVTETNVAIVVSSLTNGSFSLLAKTIREDWRAEENEVRPVWAQPQGVRYSDRFFRQQPPAAGFAPLQTFRTEQPSHLNYYYGPPNATDFEYITCTVRMTEGRQVVTCPGLYSSPVFKPSVPFPSYFSEPWSTGYPAAYTNPYPSYYPSVTGYSGDFYPSSYPGQPTPDVDLTGANVQGMTQAIMAAQNTTGGPVNFTIAITENPEEGSQPGTTGINATVASTDIQASVEVSAQVKNNGTQESSTADPAGPQLLFF